jgi:hypothetical protein
MRGRVEGRRHHPFIHPYVQPSIYPSNVHSRTEHAECVGLGTTGPRLGTPWEEPPGAYGQRESLGKAGTAARPILIRVAVSSATNPGLG